MESCLDFPGAHSMATPSGYQGLEILDIQVPFFLPNAQAELDSVSVFADLLVWSLLWILLGAHWMAGAQ